MNLLTIASAFCAAVAILALICVFLGVRAVGRLSAEAVEPAGGWPFVSILIPARNEERAIESAVRRHLECDYPNFEIVVVNDRSTDSTGEILARLAANSTRLIVVNGEEPPSGWLGKPHALAQAFARARGEWLIFADADVEYSPSALRRAVANACGRELDFLSLLPRFESRGFWEGVLMPNIYAVVYMSIGFLGNHDRFPLAVGGGGGNLVSRRAYEATGGHGTLRNFVIDDVGLAVQLRRARFRVRTIAAHDDLSVRMYRGFREVVEGFTKNLAFVFDRPWKLLPVIVAGLFLALVPYLALAFSAMNPLAARLGLVAIAVTLAARLAVARTTRMALWSAFFHPLMVAVWGGIGLRSLCARVVSQRLNWRGRTTPSTDLR